MSLFESERPNLKEYKPDKKVFRNPDKSLDRFRFKRDVVEYSFANKTPIQETFKQFVRHYYIEKKNLTSKELFELAIGLNQGGAAAPALFLIVKALRNEPRRSERKIS